MGEDSFELKTLDAFRDRVLFKSNEGRNYISIYYKHAPEITNLFATHPAFRDRTEYLITKIIPAIGEMIEGKEATIEKDVIQDAVRLIDDLSIYASSSLKEDLHSLKQEIQRGIIFETFRVKVKSS